MSTGKKNRNPITAFCWISFTVQATFSLSRLLLIPVSHKVVCLCFGFKYQKTSTFLLSGKKAGTAVCLLFLSRVLPSGIRGTTGEGRNTGSVLCFTPMSSLQGPRACRRRRSLTGERALEHILVRFIGVVIYQTSKVTPTKLFVLWH